MKPLQSMNNVDKGKLLAALFPEQVQDILDSLAANYMLLIENEETVRSTWENGLLQFDFWYRQAHQVASTVNHYGNDLKKSSTFFAERLFKGHNAIYTIDCITKQAASLPPAPENHRYRLAVQLLFDYYTASPRVLP